MVSIDRPWPPRHGGALRTLKLAEALSGVVDANVAYPDNLEQAAVWNGLQGTALPWTEPPGHRGRLSRRPRVGVALHQAMPALESLTRQCELVIYSHSYLVPWGPDLPSGTPFIVDFANVETTRQASLAQAGSRAKRFHRLLEARKAQAWEPRVARQADLSIAVTPDDAAWLRNAGANVVLCPNGIDWSAWSPSPDTGPVLFVASFGYEPNRLAAQWLMEQVWPRVRAMTPSARLLVVGRQADLLGPSASLGVEIRSDVPTVAPFYRQASMVVAPVRSGGGAQLKVAEAFAHHRAVVATEFSSLSAPNSALQNGICSVADDVDTFAGAVSSLLREPSRRHELERTAAANPIGPTWAESFQPLLDWIVSNVPARRMEVAR